jgi:Family of unknown function (DUF5825)
MLTHPVLRVVAWRDPDSVVASTVPGMALGTHDVTGPMTGAARRLVEAGARRVRLPAPVDARQPAAVPPLVLVRELTAYGVAVDWELVLDPIAHDWRELSHLYPPRTLDGAPDGGAGLARWRDAFAAGRCVVRRGPGFLQFRDQRWRGLRVLTVAAREQVELVRLLLTADAVLAVRPLSSIAGHLMDLRLVQRVGDLLWTPASRQRR